MDTQSEAKVVETRTEVSEAMRTQAARRAETVRKALPAAHMAVGSFAFALTATVAELDATSRSALYERAEKFFADAVSAAAKGVMLLCVFSGGGDESRMHEAMLEFLIMSGCQSHLRSVTASKGGFKK